MVNYYHKIIQFCIDSKNDTYLKYYYEQNCHIISDIYIYNILYVNISSPQTLTKYETIFGNKTVKAFFLKMFINSIKRNDYSTSLSSLPASLPMLKLHDPYKLVDSPEEPEPEPETEPESDSEPENNNPYCRGSDLFKTYYCTDKDYVRLKSYLPHFFPNQQELRDNARFEYDNIITYRDIAINFIYSE